MNGINRLKGVMYDLPSDRNLMVLDQVQSRLWSVVCLIKVSLMLVTDWVCVCPVRDERYDM
jgi:hypothetical protein